MPATRTSSPTLLIRHATEADLPTLISLWRKFMQFHADLDARYTLSEHALTHAENLLREKLSTPENLILLALDNATPIGYLRAAITLNPPIFRLCRIGHIAELAVIASARRRGIGQQLLRRAVTWLDGRHAEVIDVDILAANTLAARFWRKHHFTPSMQRLMLR